MTDSDPKPNAARSTAEKSLPDDALPPVEAPSSGFILQLFVIPLIIVAIIITVGFMLNWLAHSEQDPRDLVRGLRKADDASWQKAENLATLLHDPKREELKYDTELAEELAAVLRESMASENALQGHQILMRCFICQALGEFKVAQVLPALKSAATTERDRGNIEGRDPKNSTDLKNLTNRKRREVDVRLSALSAITTLIANVGADDFAEDDELLELLVEASRERGDPQRDEYLRLKLRSAAAMALGTLGRPEAIDRLVAMQDDAQAHVRYNAATGLARNGDPRCTTVLLEMLDPDNKQAAEWDHHETGKKRTRALVIDNGIKATLKLASRNKTADLAALIPAFERLRDDDELPQAVRLRGKEALLQLQRR